MTDTQIYIVRSFVDIRAVIFGERMHTILVNSRLED